MADERDDELARDVRDALALIVRALDVISDGMENRAAGSEVADKASGLYKIANRIEKRHGIRR